MTEISDNNLAIKGERQTGESARNKNVTACVAIANVVRTSLGPTGLDKLLVDDIGEVTITNDGATILKQLDVEHPAGKVLVELSDLQDKEVGDGTTSVVILAAELLRRANELVKAKIHPTSIISGYRLAQREACRYIKTHLETSISELDDTALINAASTCISSKVLNTSREHFARIAVDAMKRVRMINSIGDIKYPVKAVGLIKVHGRSIGESKLLDGYALHMARASQGMPLSVKDAKIALIDFDLRKTRMGMGVQVTLTDPTKLAKVQEEEAEMTRRKIARILDAGANVILTTKGIDDLSMKYLIERGALGMRRVPKEDIRRIAKATGGKLVLTLASMEGDELGEDAFDPENLGGAEEVVEERVGDNDCVFIKGCADTRACTVLLRGANEYMLDEVERSLHDALCVVKRVLESTSVVPGGGAVECALSIYLENFAHTLGSREQLAIGEFAQALLTIPKQLAVNAAIDALDIVAKLRAHHNTAQVDEEKAGFRFYGIDLKAGTVVDNLAKGVIEPTLSKVKSLSFATEAAVTIMRIDDVIHLAKEEEEGQGGGGGMPMGM